MTVELPTISNPGSYIYDETKPTQYTEACSHAIHQILYALSEAGFGINDGADIAAPLADISYIASLLDDLAGDPYDRL